MNECLECRWQTSSYQITEVQLQQSWLDHPSDTLSLYSLFKLLWKCLFEFSHVKDTLKSLHSLVYAWPLLYGLQMAPLTKWKFNTLSYCSTRRNAPDKAALLSRDGRLVTTSERRDWGECDHRVARATRSFSFHAKPEQRGKDGAVCGNVSRAGQT